MTSHWGAERTAMAPLTQRRSPVTPVAAAASLLTLSTLLVAPALTASAATDDPIATGTVASDSFGRTVTGGAGSADVGGDWSATVPSSTSVANGGLKLKLAAGATSEASLPAAHAPNLDVVSTISLDKAQ